jgi:small subunit ribosomal protein S9
VAENDPQTQPPKTPEPTTPAEAEGGDTVLSSDAAAALTGEAGAATATAPETPTQPAPAPSRPSKDPGGHIWGTGRRKRSIARVRIKTGSGKIFINKREVEDFFRGDRDREAVYAPLKATGTTSSFDIWANVSGGGTTGQAEAIQLGIARALVKADPQTLHTLREQGLLTRDARITERKKPGQPGARRRFQFSKR